MTGLPTRLAKRQPKPCMSTRAKEAFLGGQRLYPFSLGVCSFSPFFQQEASCDPVACMRSKLHLSLFTSLSAEPTSPRHSPGRFISSDPKGFPQLFFQSLPHPPPLDKVVEAESHIVGKTGNFRPHTGSRPRTLPEDVMARGLCTVPMPAPQPALGGFAAGAQLHPGKWGCGFKAALFLLHPLKACGLS